MLRKFRIEVEEESPDKCVETLTKYEHALQAQEVKRYASYFPVSATHEGIDPVDEKRLNELDHDWNESIGARSFFNGELGREVVEEVIEYDPSLPGYRGRRVVAFTRIDTRPPAYSFQFEIIKDTTGVAQPSEVELNLTALDPKHAIIGSSLSPTIVPVAHPQRAQEIRP